MAGVPVARENAPRGSLAGAAGWPGGRVERWRLGWSGDCRERGRLGVPGREPRRAVAEFRGVLRGWRGAENDRRSARSGQEVAKIPQSQLFLLLKLVITS